MLKSFDPRPLAERGLKDAYLDPALVTPPLVSLKILDQCAALGLEKVWLQPGAESEQVVARAHELGLKLVYDACIMVMAARATRD